MIPLWVKNRGEQITDSATFRWLAQDAGSGAVDLTLLKGSGSATFTRAGATATTVLSTGLVSSTIAANTARSYYDPAPVGGQGSYMYLPGVSGAYASTPDSAAVSITGDIDIRVYGSLKSWTPATNYVLLNKLFNVGQFSYDIIINTAGTISFRVSLDGTTVVTSTSTVATGISANTVKWIRCTRSATTGDVKFYLSDDNVTFTQLGTTVSNTAGNIFDGTDQINIGGYGTNVSESRIYRAQIYNGINGTLVADFDPTRTTQASTSFAASTGETWTINGRGFIYAAPVYLGYLAEEARTNLILQSEDLTTTWASSAATISANAIAAPDGNTTADKIQEDATTASHYVTQTVAKAASSLSYAVSFFCKAAERSWCFIQATDGANGAQAWFNLSSGAVGTTSTFGAGFTVTSANTKLYPNGWWRCVLILTSSTAVTIQQRCCVATGDAVSSYAGSAGSGIYCWGAGLEQASFATTYIPTAAATVTRAEDNMSFASAGNAITSSGTVFCRAMTVDTSTTRGLVGINDGGNNNYSSLFINNPAGATRCQVISGAVTQADVSVGTLAANTVGRHAMAWAANYANAYANGTPGTLDTSVTVPVSFTTISIGRRFADLNLNGCIRDVRIWQRVLSDSEVQAL